MIQPVIYIISNTIKILGFLKEIIVFIIDIQQNFYGKQNC